MGFARTTNRHPVASFSPLFYCVMIVLLCAMHATVVAAISTSTSRSLFAPGKYMAYQQTVTVDPSTHDYQIFDSTIQDSTTISMSIDGVFGPNTDIYMYVTPTDVERCIVSSCHYPGTWFVLPIEDARASDSYQFNWFGAHFRSAFATLNQHNGTPLSSSGYPSTFTVDYIVPLDTFTSTNTTDTITWTFAASIVPTNIILNADFDISSSGSYTDVSSSSSTRREWDNYKGFGLKLKQLEQSTIVPATLDLDLVSRKRDDFDMPSTLSFQILEIAASHKLYFSSSTTDCSFSASSSLDKFFWGISQSSGTLTVRTWPFDEWPRRLSVKCLNSAYYTTPAWFYVWQDDTTTRVEHPTQKVSNWSPVDTNVRTQEPIRIISTSSSNEDPLSVQSQQLTTLQSSADPSTSQSTTQFLSDALIRNTQTVFAGRTRSFSADSFEASTRVDSSGSDPLTVGAIIGIVVGCIAGIVVLILLIVLCCLCCRSSRSDSHKPKSDTVQMGLAQPHQAVQVATYTTTTTTTTMQPQPDYQQQYTQNQSFGQPQQNPYSQQQQQQQQYIPQQYTPQQSYAQPTPQQPYAQPQHTPHHQPQPHYEQPQPQYDPQQSAPKEELPPAYGE